MAARGVGGATPLPPQFLHGAPWRPTLWQPPSPAPPSGLAAAAARLASTQTFRDLVAKAWLKTKQDRPLGEVRLRFTKEHDAAYDFSPEFAWQCPPERETVTGDLPLYALPQLAARRPLAAAAAARAARRRADGGGGGGAAARAARRAHELAPALAPSDFNAFTELHDHVDAESDALALSELEPEQAALVRRGGDAPMVAHLKATVAAPLLACAEAALHCPRRTWCTRRRRRRRGAPGRQRAGVRGLAQRVGAADRRRLRPAARAARPRRRRPRRARVEASARSPSNGCAAATLWRGAPTAAARRRALAAGRGERGRRPSGRRARRSTFGASAGRRVIIVT